MKHPRRLVATLAAVLATAAVSLTAPTAPIALAQSSSSSSAPSGGGQETSFEQIIIAENTRHSPGSQRTVGNDRKAGQFADWTVPYLHLVPWDSEGTYCGNCLRYSEGDDRNHTVLHKIPFASADEYVQSNYAWGPVDGAPPYWGIAFRRTADSWIIVYTWSETP
ncbi:hypothetical protein B842_04810 [Corynebacterium humireducens NBRC 106098 = DSM 45392]|uniref:Secreted protein n=1 Tax=Corynebacterium humireducens NBRC 106098 = DSM 45392 TaxID=1223515 RepID=A0A0B5D9E9_9CORY|nr:hypothetical protein [Corynebacterium humireducens]AJE32813.1 hypothetical protein B842_04810 [Corynebacterium humireducens NBRC 106098 = DSM 45392]